MYLISSFYCNNFIWSNFFQRTGPRRRDDCCTV